MNSKKLNIVLILGFLAIIGIVVVQFLWTRQAFDMEGKKFSEKVHISLLGSIERLYEYTNSEFPLNDPINKVSNGYYIVNVNNDFDAAVLEYCLRTEFIRAGLITDFEYAIYKCESDEMVYGKYVSVSSDQNSKSSFYFPKQQGLVYYFAIRFPHETSYVLGSLKLLLTLSFILLLILLIYVYSVFIILQQKRYSELQKDFINNMTHEFKTPLSSVMIAATYLSKQDEIKNDSKLAKYTGMIINQGMKLNGHIEKILNVGRTDSSPLSLEKKTFSPNKIISDVADNMSLKYEGLSVSISSGDGNIMITADEFHFSNLVYNLVDNSVKYCEGKPEIRINITKIQAAVRIEFIDNGIGISEKHHSSVFGKFYRVPGPKSNEVNGFGLGLYYVKKICHLHSWKLSVSNNKNNIGTKITILIPVKP